MRRPIPRLISQKYGNNIPAEQPEDIARSNPDYADKLKLATSLHEQGVDPIRWQEAEPAPYAAQRLYRETRQAPEDMFVAQDRLYRRSPAIAATPDQGKDALDVYLGSAPRPVAELVPVDRVQLRHPLGNKPGTLPTGSEALERYRRFAKLGIDPDNAHEGDAIPHHLQDGLKRAVIGTGGNEMPLGIPGVYRNPDDDFFYLAHSGTEESQAVKELRRRLATEKMERTGSADPIAANDNDPDIDEAVAQFYWRRKEQETINTTKLHQFISANRNAYNSAIKKLQNKEPLSPIEKTLGDQISNLILQNKKFLTPTTPVSRSNPDNQDTNSSSTENSITDTPTVWGWILDLFRGVPEGEGCPKPDCDEVFKHCRNVCQDIMQTQPNNLPGSGSDKHGRFRRCVRECMESHGCFNY